MYVAGPFHQVRKDIQRPKPNKWRIISTAATSCNHVNGQFLVLL